MTTPSVTEHRERAVPGARSGDLYPWKVLAVTTLGCLLAFVNSSSVNVALPAISAEFGIPAATADWVLLSYMLALTTTILVFARISDMFGRRRFYLGGLILMTAASLVGSVTVEPVALIVCRILQGIATAAIITNMNAQLADAFPPRLLALGLSINVMMASVASMLGPAVGGVLLGAFDWRALFLVNVPFGIAAITLGLVFLRKEKARDRSARPRFDLGGALLSGAGLALFLLGINRMSAWGWQDWRPWALLAGAVVTLVAFGLVERRTASPLVDFALARERARGLAYATAFFMSFGQAAVLVLVILYQQLVVGASPAETGLVAALTAGAVMVASPLAGIMSRWFSSRTVSSTGAFVSLCGYTGVLFSFATVSEPPVLIVSLILIGAGNGIFTAPNTAAIMGGLPADRRGISNGIRSVMFNSAQTLGTAIVLLVVTQTLLSLGVDGYAGRLDQPLAAVGGFQLAATVLVFTGVAAVLCSALRGGPWRSRFPERVDTGRIPVAASSTLDMRGAA